MCILNTCFLPSSVAKTGGLFIEYTEVEGSGLQIYGTAKSISGWVLAGNRCTLSPVLGSGGDKWKSSSWKVCPLSPSPECRQPCLPFWGNWPVKKETTNTQTNKKQTLKTHLCLSRPTWHSQDKKALLKHTELPNKSFRASF